MAHFAEIEDGVVTRVLVVDNEYEHRGEDYLANELGLGGEWVQTSYSGSFGGKFAGIGDIYDENTGQFFPPQPYPSWQLSSTGWVAPKPQPNELAVWDEAAQAWKDAD